MACATDRRGYTLLELLLVMAILVVMGALAFPALDTYYANFKVTAAADAVKGAWAEARERAIQDGIAYRFSLVPGTRHFRIAPDRADYWTGSRPDPDDPSNPPLILERSLPKNVVFNVNGGDNSAPTAPTDNRSSSSEDDPVDPSQYVTVTVFLPVGTAQNDVELRLETKGASPLTLRLRALTGTFRTLTAKEVQ
jgi:prepilin-type N-terminal cleavage/methylation domain-containing protein